MRFLITLALLTISCGGDDGASSKGSTRLTFTDIDSGSEVFLSNTLITASNVSEVLVIEEDGLPELPFSIFARKGVEGHESSNNLLLAFGAKASELDQPVLPIYVATQGAVVISDPERYLNGTTVIVVIE